MLSGTNISHNTYLENKEKITILKKEKDSSKGARHDSEKIV